MFRFCHCRFLVQVAFIDLFVASVGFRSLSHPFDQISAFTMDVTALLCNICPKRPRFSDVSHLLTHVSSKAHLSFYFKLQVRSHQEPQAGKLLVEYDQWYKANNLAKLLSDRMASKETRNRKRQGRVIAQGASIPTRQKPGIDAASNLCSFSHKPFSGVSDPHFLDDKTGLAAGSMDSIPLSTGFMVPAWEDGSEARVQLRRPFVMEESPEMSTPSQLKMEYDSDSDDEIGSILHATPQWSREHGFDAKHEIDPRLLQGSFVSDPFVDDGDSFSNTPTNGIERERADEIARLKGVLWPGMDIFDSATEKMRRKRNQKKDESVLKMMEKTSLDVEPTELVFSPSGVLRKQRVINGDVDDSSPLKGETPIPKRRPVRPKRPVFAGKDPNIIPRHRQGIEKTKRVASLSPNKPPVRAVRRVARDATNHLPISRHSRGHSPFRDDNHEFDLSAGRVDRQSRGRFAVFQDTQTQGNGPYLAPQMSSQLPTFRQPTPTNSHDSNYSRRDACHPTGKENLDPILNTQGRIETIGNWHSPFIKRNYHTSEAGYPPHYFFGDAPRSPFSPIDGRNLSGYTWNPLATSLPRLPMQEKEDHIYNDNIPAYTRQPANRVASPDGTISDAEKDDFERLYLDGTSY